MDKDTVLKEMIYNISDEIGTDISYISTNQKGYQYRTGVEFTMILAAGISSMFFIPLITGFANKLGEELANTAIEQLKKIVNRSKKQLQERDTNSEIKSRQITAVQDYLESNCFPHEKAKLLAEQVYEIMNDAIMDAVDESE